MTAPGGGFGEGGHDDNTDSPPTGGEASEPAPWESPAAESAPPAYPPPGPTDHPPGYPPSYPPPVPPPPGYEQPPGYFGPPYPMAPPPYGGPSPYGAHGYPGYYPPPDYQGGYPTQAAVPGTNALAIASLIASFTGLLCGLGSIVAIVLGAIALDQIKRTRQEGFGLAVAGIVIGIATLVVILVVVLFTLRTH